MMQEPDREQEQLSWLGPEDQTRLDAFKAYAVNHPLLDDVDRQLTQAILEPAGFTHVLVYGPSGVGKTKMLERVTSRLRTFYAELQAQEPLSPRWRTGRTTTLGPFHPLLVLQPEPPNGQTFSRADYYHDALTTLGETHYKQWSLVDLNVDQTWETRTKSRAKGRTPQFNDQPALRHALQEALVSHAVRAVIVDEGQHLMKVPSGAKLLDQLDWLKSMTNTTGVLHVLVGTYDLLDFRTLNGQAARRGYDIHFPRYQVQHEADRKAFQGALHALLLHIPLQMDMQDLMDHWYYFYERSIGCVGVLKDWFVRAYHAALRSRLSTLTLTHMQTHTLSNARCESMITDANAAEQKLHYTESSREHLWNLLGMSGIPGSSVQSADRQAEMGSRASSPKRPGRVGERAPGRDPVGEAQPEGEASKCSFAGMIELSARQMTEAGVLRVECPECLTMRALTPQGATVRFPPHDKRKTRTPHREVRWIKRGTTWTLSDKNV
jgi:AAA domain